jgi:outer membrane receptor protein involved in Fe transport
VTYGANYTYLDATYRSSETINGGGNSSNDGPAPGFDGNITVSPGNRIPLVPRQMGKIYVDWQVTPQLSLDADMQAVSSSYAAGNENNRHAPDGVYYLGAGKSPGYAVFNLGVDYRPVRQLKLFAQVTNLFDRKYSTAAQLGPTGFTDAETFIARPFPTPVIDGERAVVNSTFYAPGAPRLVWAGVRYDFD